MPKSIKIKVKTSSKYDDSSPVNLSALSDVSRRRGYRLRHADNRKSCETVSVISVQD